MEFVNLDIPDVVLIKPKVFRDERGFFLETFRSSFFQDYCADREFVQDNHSASTKGVLRGLHIQLRNTQGKLIRVIRGEILDVVVDVRLDSKTYGKWVSAQLNEENHHQLWVPEGFAHGFIVLSDYAEIAYKCTNYYSPEYEQTLAWDDAKLGIDWNLPKEIAPILSDKDSKGLSLDQLRLLQLQSD